MIGTETGKRTHGNSSHLHIQRKNAEATPVTGHLLLRSCRLGMVARLEICRPKGIGEGGCGIQEARRRAIPLVATFLSPEVLAIWSDIANISSASQHHHIPSLPVSRTFETFDVQVVKAGTAVGGGRRAGQG